MNNIILYYATFISTLINLNMLLEATPLPNHIDSLINAVEWRIGGKIHFEEDGGSDYLGTKEINEIVRNILKSTIDVTYDSCSNNAKIMLKQENNQLTITHYEEKNKPGIGEEMHATLLYTQPRGFCDSETLKQVYGFIFEIQETPPTILNVSETYSSIIKSDWKFKISEVVLNKNATGFFLSAKLLFDGHENIYRNNNPISAGLHLTLVNSNDYILESKELSDQLVEKINLALQNKMIKIAQRNGVVDLEFGISGSSWRIRAGQYIE